MRRYAPDLTNDPIHVFLNRLYFVPLIICGIALLWFGGVTFLVWGAIVRVVFALHSTWLVNSVTHLWGTRRFDTADDSTNNWWVALLTFGEGWHNNHHAFARAARHGLTWYELDLNWIMIRLLQIVGLVRSVHVIDMGVEANARLRKAA